MAECPFKVGDKVTDDYKNWPGVVVDTQQDGRHWNVKVEFENGFSNWFSRTSLLRADLMGQ